MSPDPMVAHGTVAVTFVIVTAFLWMTAVRRGLARLLAVVVAFLLCLGRKPKYFSLI